MIRVKRFIEDKMLNDSQILYNDNKRKIVIN